MCRRRQTFFYSLSKGYNIKYSTLYQHALKYSLKGHLPCHIHNFIFKYYKKNGQHDKALTE